MPDETRTIVDNHGYEHDVIMWTITQVGWEYFVTEMDKKTKRGFGYVQGLFDEWGSFTKEEIEEQGLMGVASAGDGTLNEVEAPKGWHWKNVIN